VVTVVLLPGMDGSGALFEDFVSELKARSIVVSYPVDQPLGYRELEELVLASLPSNESFIVLAESFSGPIAISLATRQLPQLRAVVLVCSFAKLPLAFPVALRKFLASLPFWRAPAPVAASALMGRFSSRTAEAKLKRAIRTVGSDVWKARLRAVLAVDTTASLCRIHVPLLYLRASEDRVVFRSASALISEHLPAAKVVEVEGPHFLLQAKPRESAAEVRAFANENGLAL
jgi:pimeloyl-[acyl-carrier protein] methyl ester esterase